MSDLARTVAAEDGESTRIGTELDPLPALVPPVGTELARVRAIAERVRGAAVGRIDVTGVRGSAGAVIAAEIARDTQRKIVLVSADVDDARRAASDLAFLIERPADRVSEEAAEDIGAGDVLVLASNESSPYADVNPDRRGAMARLATLHHLASGEPWRALVIPAAALARKLLPRTEITKHTHVVIAEDGLDRDKLLASLVESGYTRAPLVEDPGTFAVRGSLLDVWPPSSELPCRIELYGDMVVSIKPFDPNEQKTLADQTLAKIALPPAREAILTRDNAHRAKRRIEQLADMIDLPTMRARALMDDVMTGRAFFGAEGFLPAYYDDLDSLADYIPEDAVFIVEDPPSVTKTLREELERAWSEAAAKTKEPYFVPNSLYLEEAEVVSDLAKRSVVLLHRTAVLGATEGGLDAYTTTNDAMDVGAHDHEDLTRAVKAARASHGRTATLAPLARRIAHFRDHGLRVLIAARAETQAERLRGLLFHQGVKCRVRTGAFDAAWLREPPDAAEDASCEIVVGPLARGVVMPAEGLALVTEEEVFGARAHRRRERKGDSSRAFVEDLRSLSVGDLVVHVEHGIGRYLGLVHKEVAGLTVDLLCIEYSNTDKLYLPVYRLNQIQKYSGGEKAAPKLDRLGGLTFAKTKARVAREVRQMADELLKLYAERQAMPGDALPAADDDYRAFEATFPFDETPDQAKAIDDVNKDLEAPRPMDRLVCGDVGFGKTEVAIRAAFRVACEGKQVAVLCPTTVLAQQHFRVFEGRMHNHALNVRAMSRFETKKEQEETLAALKDGKCDIVIGTHRLLSKDIHFKNLGLLVVDEEQRFGVTHKERIKQLRAAVDVLTLSATPIPRTLQMAVSGIRDLSLITTAPADRRAVRTIVTRFDEHVLTEAVTRELARGGQVFYVYNRVEHIYEKATRLQQMLPNARIAVAHGQMSAGSDKGESNLERTMLDFIDGRYDVLVATAIVESGLDIPRANTIIIDRADLFGLAQLYQLRGRVGRSKERAYCYLVVPPQDAMTDEARARIEALERHTELGSGFKIASLDLELRGAGDLLGAEQSGTVSTVGFELFCQMLEEAVHELRGEPVVHDVDPELSFDVEALIPDDYIGEVGVRLSLYKRLASAMDEGHVSEIATEMEDRFGPPPDAAKRFVRLMALKTELRRLKALGCEANARVVTLHLREDTPLDPQKILALVRAPKSPYRLTPDMRLSRRMDLGKNDAMADGLASCELVLGELAKCMKASA